MLYSLYKSLSWQLVPEFTTRMLLLLLLMTQLHMGVCPSGQCQVVKCACWLMVCFNAELIHYTPLGHGIVGH